MICMSTWFHFSYILLMFPLEVFNLHLLQLQHNAVHFCVYQYQSLHWLSVSVMQPKTLSIERYWYKRCPNHVENTNVTDIPWSYFFIIHIYVLIFLENQLFVSTWYHTKITQAIESAPPNLGEWPICLTPMAYWLLIVWRCSEHQQVWYWSKRPCTVRLCTTWLVDSYMHRRAVIFPGRSLSQIPS